LQGNQADCWHGLPVVWRVPCWGNPVHILNPVKPGIWVADGLDCIRNNSNEY
jgi:hypothetical protein